MFFLNIWPKYSSSWNFCSLFFTLVFSDLFFKLLLFISDSILHRFGTRWHSVLLFVENRAIVENKIQGFEWIYFLVKVIFYTNVIKLGVLFYCIMTNYFCNCRPLSVETSAMIISMPPISF